MAHRSHLQCIVRRWYGEHDHQEGQDALVLSTRVLTGASGGPFRLNPAS